jgi:cytochrome c553
VKKATSLIGPVVLLLCLQAFAWWFAIAVNASERSGQWRGVRDAYVAAHPTCEACGDKDAVQVHHVLPFHLWPEKELDPTNLITLCPRCHIALGHLGDFRAFNPLVRQDAARHLAEVKARPYKREDAARFEKQFATAP